MKKKFKLFAFIALTTTYYSNAQMGINTKFPDASAALEIKSPDNTKGVLIPRSTTAQITSIPLPAEGLIVYDTTQRCFMQNAGTSAIPNWVPLVNTADNGLTTTGGKIQLGGTLTKPTALATTAANTLAIQGLVNSTDSADSPIVLTVDGTLKKSSFPVANVVPTDVGSVIAIDGKLEVAQEITALMNTDFTVPALTSNNIPYAIGNINNVIIDNKGTLVHTASSNSFTVKSNGVYLITMNLQMASNTGGPVTGVWCDTDNKWVARINTFGTTWINSTLITSVNLDASKTYSFRAGHNEVITVKAFSTGSTGTGPVAFFSVKRLK